MEGVEGKEGDEGGHGSERVAVPAGSWHDEDTRGDRSTKDPARVAGGRT